MDINNKTALGEIIAKALAMKGIPKQKHISHTSRVLDITTAAAQKKMTGASNWEVSQLVKVIDSIDMKMSDFFDIYNYSVNEVHTATWHDGKANVKCKIYLSTANSNEPTEYSALKINDEWVVFHTDDIKDEVLFESKRNIDIIQLYPQKQNIKKHRIAILDDEKNIVDNLQEIIANKEYLVDAFYDITSLEDSVKHHPYDAYILDWVVGTKTVFNTIKVIRNSENKNAMILVLTGQLTGIADSEIASAINDYDITGPYEKPIKASVIKSLINKHFPK
ncbi:helix-turn-helix domain-containing protein [Serratia entomophila]|uniref:helix-turn-helix domain-containing protein n=1 Tax=Serratia entomophila TaxID=42906 RepID=UPI00217AFABB|nr:helix-turn-helix domain-containing protein [Serratia entomophila]CAI1047525.1 BetR domain [Serratia entomophila]CAI1841151.1 BetR domain [Serratia entomophila]CAI2503997.1 BetR domain [Serratia entomophila]